MNSPRPRKPRRPKAIRRQRRRKADNVCRLQSVPHDSAWNSNRSVTTTSSKHVYEIRPRKDRRGSIFASCECLPVFHHFFAPSLGHHVPNFEASYEIGTENLIRWTEVDWVASTVATSTL